MSERILIKDGWIISMDPAVGTLERGSILVEGDRIVRIGTDIEADAEVIDATGMIVMPGMVDTHRHTWQSLLRALYADSHILQFFASLRFALDAEYTAEDAYMGNYLGGLEAAEAGVTTILDYSHCIHTPEHGDALVNGLRDAGVRAVYGYGLAASPGVTGFGSIDERLKDAQRIAETYLSADDGLLTRGIALSEMGLLPFWDHVKEIRFANELGAVMTTHTGAIYGTEMSKGVRELAQNDLLSENQVHVHCNWLDEDEWKLLAEAGSKVSITPETELGMGVGVPPIRTCLQHGIKPTLGCDITSLNSGDLISQARLGLNYQRYADADPVCLGGMPTNLDLSSQDALEWVTVNGAEACGLDSRIGSLTEGKQADILLIGGDSLNMFPKIHGPGTVVFQANSANVRTVLVAGKVRKRDGKLVGVDMKQVQAKVEHQSSTLIERAKANGTLMPDVPPGLMDAMNPVWAGNIAKANEPEPREV